MLHKIFASFFFVLLVVALFTDQTTYAIFNATMFLMQTMYVIKDEIKNPKDE